MATSLVYFLHAMLVLSFVRESESATKATGVACVNSTDNCSDTNASCKGTSGGTTCKCNTNYYAASTTCTLGVDLNGDCSAVAAALKDTACQAKNAKTTCVTSGGKTLCTCNSGYYDSDGTSTPGGTCVAVLTASCTDETKCSTIDSNAECTDAVGSKTCKCKSGYTGGAGDVCSQNAAERNAAFFWLYASLVLLTAKTILL